MKKRDLIEQWLKQAKSLSFFLPDGPYGRPFDNQYFFKDATENEHGILINLSDRITLAFVGNIKVAEEGKKILISGFDQFDFIVDSKVIKSFFDGEVCLYRF